MDFVLTLIADPREPAIDRQLVDAVRGGLSDVGATTQTANWLGRERRLALACDIAFGGIAEADAEAQARRLVAGRPIDVAALPVAHRRKRLLVADMDSTMIEVECIDELAAAAGLRAEVAAITERAMKGELDFAGALRARAMMLRGLETEVFAKVYAERVRPMSGGRTLVATMRAHGAYTALVSGGFTEFTSRVREALGFHVDHANRLLLADGRLTGEVEEPIAGAGAKLAILRRLTEERGLAVADTLAVGDGANDVPMIEAAGLGVAYHAKPVAASAAKARIDHGDLTALLYLQGYRQRDFVE
jgi:phosphoserine phosphatase